MKRLRPLAAVIMSAFLFSGCSFSFAASVDELISPILPAGENAAVQNALKSYCENSFTLKSPASGEYNTPYIFYDFDCDGETEAVAFYEAADDSGLTNMALITKDSGEWAVACNIEGGGADVYSIEFADLNSDGVPEFIVLWDIISNSTSHMLCVYFQSSSSDGVSLSKSDDTITLNNYICVDMDLDGTNEILAFTMDSANTTAKATMYQCKGKSLRAAGSTKLDGHISYYSSLSSESGNGYIYIFADAVSSDGSGSLTEIVKYSDYYGTIISPYYSYTSAVTSDTARSFIMTSRDVDANGVVEIPLEASYETGTSRVTAVDWQYYNGTALKHSHYSLAVLEDGYQVFVPDDYIDDSAVSVEYSTKKSELTVKDSSGKTAFSVRSLLKSAYQQSPGDYEGYIELFSSSGYIYLAKLGSSEKISLTQSELMEMVAATA